MLVLGQKFVQNEYVKNSKFERRTIDSELVTDQPGFLIFLGGLAIAIVAGLFFRGFFSPDKIRAHLTGAAANIHKNIKVDFSSAELSLSKNGLPRVAVIVKDVKLLSSESCWMAPEINIDEIILPISIKNLVLGHSAVSELNFGKMELKLAGEWKFCQPRERTGATPADATSSKKSVALIETEKPADIQLQEQIRELRIDEVKLVHKNLENIPSLLTNVVISLKSVQPKIILLQAQSYFFNENQQRDYTSRGEIHIEYNEFPERKLQTHVLGQFREGHFTIQMQNRLDEGEYNLELDLRHLPLSKIFSTLRGFGFSAELNPKQAWLSLKGKSRGFLDKIQSESFEVKDLKLEGDVGELSTELIEFSQLNPLKMKPFLMKAEQLDLGKVLSFYNKSQIIPILGDLGRFSGRIEIFDNEEFRFFGFHRGLEFIFSSLGRRELQKINQMSLDASLKKKKWNLKLNRFEMENGKFAGELHLNADRNFQKIDTKVMVEHLSLSPQVQNLVTQGGGLAPFRGNLNFIWEEGVLQKILGLIESDEATVNQIKLENLAFQFENSSGTPFVLKTKFQNVMIAEDYLTKSFLSPAVKPQWIVNGGIHLNKVTGQMKFAHDRSAEWRGFQANLTGGVEKLASDGGWTSQGILDATLSLKSPRGNTKWKITGTRDEPTIKELGDSATARTESASH